MGAEQCLLDMAVPKQTHVVGVVSLEKSTRSFESKFYDGAGRDP